MNVELETNGFLRIVDRRVDYIVTPPQNGKLANLTTPPEEEKGNCMKIKIWGGRSGWG
jgi:hypothetical protein